jgi:hypothetical protein
MQTRVMQPLRKRRNLGGSRSPPGEEALVMMAVTVIVVPAGCSRLRRERALLLLIGFEYKTQDARHDHEC